MHMLKREGIKFINCIDYPTLSNEHTWEDRHIQLRNHQTYTSDNHNIDCRFANATKDFLLCDYDL